MKTQKRNVSTFNADIKENQGYLYTTNATYSSLVANHRITEATAALIPNTTKTVIDIGCGDGTFTHCLKLIFPEISFTGFDPASEAINIAKTKFPSVDYIVGDLLNISTFPNIKFDLAILRGVIHHLPNASAGIANAVHLSDRIILIEPNGNNPILKWLEKNSKYHLDHEERSFSSDKLRQWCEQTGFVVTDFNFVGFIPFFFPTLLSKIIYFIQPWLERGFILKKYFGAQSIIVYERSRAN